MEKKTISKETLERVKNLPRIDYFAYLELIKQGQVERFIKLKIPRTIFFDENEDCFLYLNPYHLILFKCGTFKTKNL